MSRVDLAQDIAAGLAGWLQLQVVQKLGDLSGEDSARLVAAQIVNAQGRYEPATSQLPPNWGATKKRVDIALRARSAGAETWYGAIEIKWPGSAFDVSQTRLQVVQDAMRLTFITTNSLNAHFLVLGGSSQSIKRLFDDPHPQAKEQEDRRLAFRDLFSQDLDSPSGEATFNVWSQRFPGAGERVPSTSFSGFQGKLKTELLAVGKAKVGKRVKGRVFIWQCNKTKGPSR
jgi:hypothetical protein